MSLMCPLKGCKEQQGMCGHEKIMLMMVALVGVGFAAFTLL